MHITELSKEKNELEGEIQMLQGEVESKSSLILTLQSQLEVIYNSPSLFLCLCKAFCCSDNMCLYFMNLDVLWGQ